MGKDCIRYKIWISYLLAELDSQAVLVCFIPDIPGDQSVLYVRKPGSCQQQDVCTYLITRRYMGIIILQYERNVLW